MPAVRTRRRHSVIDDITEFKVSGNNQKRETNSTVVGGRMSANRPMYVFGWGKSPNYCICIVEGASRKDSFDMRNVPARLFSPAGQVGGGTRT